jgi:hypothetical protein
MRCRSLRDRIVAVSLTLSRPRERSSRRWTNIPHKIPRVLEYPQIIIRSPYCGWPLCRRSLWQ